MQRFILVIFVVVLAQVGLRPAEAQVMAGTVTRLQGTASVTRDAVNRPLTLGDTIFAGDNITTGDVSRLQVRLSGGTVLTLGDRSDIVVESPETAERGGVLAVVRGVFLATTRAIADLSRDSLMLKTPTAVLGVRGTTVWGHQQPDHLATAMLAGTAVVVTTPEGSISLSEALQGTDARAGQPPTPPVRWGAARLRASFAAVAFD